MPQLHLPHVPATDINPHTNDLNQGHSVGPWGHPWPPVSYGTFRSGSFSPHAGIFSLWQSISLLPTSGIFILPRPCALFLSRPCAFFLSRPCAALRRPDPAAPADCDSRYSPSHAQVSHILLCTLTCTYRIPFFRLLLCLSEPAFACISWLM